MSTAIARAGSKSRVGLFDGALHALLEVEDITKLKVSVNTKKGGDVFEIAPKHREKLLREYHCGRLDAQYAGNGLADVQRRHERFARSRVATGRWRKSARAGMILIRQENGVVNTGIDNMMNRWGGTAAPAAPGFIGVDNNTTAVTLTTAFLHGAGAGSAATTIIKAFSPAIAYARPTLTAGATFVNADFTSGVFFITKVGWLNTSTDAGTGLIDVIGGTGGVDPYSRTFSIDFTAVGTFTLIPQIAMTAITVKGSFPSPL